MLKKKKNLLLASSLAGLIVGATALSITLSSCTTNTNVSDSSNVQYSHNIDWNDEEQVKRLIIDNNGLVYADKTKTTIIAVSPKTMLSTITIPSTVKNISGYVKVTTDSKGVKVYQSVGAFQNMVSLNSIVLETGSQLKSIDGLAFSGCIALESISGLTNSLDYIGVSAFANCINLKSIDTSNVIKVDNNAFVGCTSLESVDLSKAIAIGDNAFQNCSNLTSIGSLEKATTIGQYAFNGAIKRGSNITLKLSNLTIVPHSAFASAQGITKVDFSNNTLLTTVSDNAFMWSSATEADFTGCSRLISINERAFEGCKNLTTVYLPSNDITNLTTIGWNGFINCTNLTTIGAKGMKANSFIATNKMSSIGANFLANTAITSIDLSEFKPDNSSNEPFGSLASLAYIPNLSSLTLPSNLTKLNPGLLYASGIGDQGGFALELPSTITSIVYSSNIKIANANNTNNTVKFDVPNATPFTNSGITSIDMSKITSYQLGSESRNKIPSYLFNGATKLKSVVLKPSTTEIEQYAFQNTTSLTSISYPETSDTPSAIANTNGFTATSALTTIGVNAFKGAFNIDSDFTFDLSAMTSMTTTPAAFSDSKISNLVLPVSVETIAADSFDNMTKLKSVNFTNLTNLSTIYKSNFTNTLLDSIDLSKTKLTTINNATNSGSGKLFTNLPNNCIVSLPSTVGNFTDVFTNTSGAYVTFNYPNGVNATSLLNIDNNGVMTFKDSINRELLTNTNTLNLSSTTGIKSIGVNTFFGSKLTSLTLPADGVNLATNKLFQAGTGITVSANNTTPNSSYAIANVPFGGTNMGLTSLNYTGFIEANSANKVIIDTAATDTSAQSNLFKTTTNDTWEKVVKIINSLSYQNSNVSTSSDASALKANMSAWTSGTAGANQAINPDAVATLANESASVSFTNSYASTSDATNPITIQATANSATIFHNGINWTYTNDGSTIKLIGDANMYKATNSDNNSYLVFFNQSAYTIDGTTYYTPNKTSSVRVTLTIATKASTN